MKEITPKQNYSVPNSLRDNTGEMVTSISDIVESFNNYFSTVSANNDQRPTMHSKSIDALSQFTKS